MTAPPRHRAEDQGAAAARLDDAALIERSWHEPEAFAALYDRHAAPIYRFAGRRLGDQMADNVVGETFLAAFRRRKRRGHRTRQQYGNTLVMRRSAAQDDKPGAPPHAGPGLARAARRTPRRATRCALTLIRPAQADRSPLRSGERPDPGLNAHKFIVASMVSRRLGRTFPELAGRSPLAERGFRALSLAGCFRARSFGNLVRAKTENLVRATAEGQSGCWCRRRHAASGVGLTARSARPARAGTCRRRCRDVCARRSARVWPVRGPGGTGPWPVLPRRSPSGAWPPGPVRGGSCLRERLCSTEVITPYPTKPSAANTAIKARKSITGAQE